MTDARIEIVARGYDEITERFLDWVRRIEDDPRMRFLEELERRLPERAHVLELGCGAGEPCTRLLAERFSVTGVDISRRQLELARTYVPSAELVHADFLELDLPPASVDAVCSFYVLNNVPRERLAELITRIATWLRPGGIFMNAFPTSDIPEWTGDFLGTRMFFSGFEPPENRRLVEEAGLSIFHDEVVTFTEPYYGLASFQWILAER